MRSFIVVTLLLALASFTTLSFYDKVFAQNADQIKVLAQVVPDNSEYTDNTYIIDNFEMSASNNSQICPSNNCEFQLEDGELRQNTYSSNLYPMTGILRVGTSEGSGDMRYKVYDTDVDFKVFETLEKSDQVIHSVDGTIKIGGDVFNPLFKYRVINGTLTFENSDEDSNAILNLVAEKSNAR